MRTRENNVLNLLKRAIFYAANGAPMKEISFTKSEEPYLIANFDIYHAYATDTESKSKQESAYQATERMGCYLHDRLELAKYHKAKPTENSRNDPTTNSLIAFLEGWNEFLFTDCITPGYLSGLSVLEAELVKESPLPKEKQYDLYQFVLFNNPSTEALQEEIRNRVSAKATGTAGLMSGAPQYYRDPNDLQVALRLA